MPLQIDVPPFDKGRLVCHSDSIARASVSVNYPYRGQGPPHRFDLVGYRVRQAVL